MATIFTKIYQGDIPSYAIANTKDYYAFLDINPLQRGHTLVIPKVEVDYIFDLPEDLYLGLFAFSKYIALAIQRAVPCKRVGVAVVGFEVPHAHVHLVPLQNLADINFSNPRKSFTPDEFESTSNLIKEELKIILANTVYMA